MSWGGPFNNTTNITLSGVEFAFNEAIDSAAGNTAGWDSVQNSLNSDWPGNETVYASGNSSIEDLTGSEWETPPLRGDGSREYP